MLTAAILSAQTSDYFEFVDKDGNVVPDGTTLTFTEVTPEEDLFTGEVINYMYARLSVRNKTATNRALRIKMAINRIDNGNYQLCFPMACKTYSQAVTTVTEGGLMSANELRDLQTEWLPADKGGCDVVLTIEVLNMTGSIFNPTFTHLADGPAVTLHYRNGIGDPDPELKGDISGNGSVDVEDMNILINILLGKDDAARYDGRANIDGIEGIDTGDINALVNIMLGK